MTSQARDAIVAGAGSIGQPIAGFLAQAGLAPDMAKVKMRRTWRGAYPVTPGGSPTVSWTEELEGTILAELSPDRGLSRRGALA